MRQRLLFSFLVIIISMAGLDIFTLLSITGQDRALTSRLDRQIELHSIHVDIQELNSLVSSYLRSGNDDYRLLYSGKLEVITGKLSRMGDYLMDYQQVRHSVRDLEAMLLSCREKAEGSFRGFERGDPFIYVWDAESEYIRYTNYFREELEKLESSYLDRFQEFFTRFTAGVNRNLRINAGFIIIFFLICYLLAWNFSLNVSQPIHFLALELIRFGTTGTAMELSVPERKDEISILFQSFNEMTGRIRNQIEGIQEKSHLEQQLKDQEIRHHKTESLLREAELALLQSQINPHFLFNTLNIIDSLSNLEDAPQTGEMIRSLSGLLRYNLINQKQIVRLEEEMEFINSYIYIQKKRFGEKIVFRETVDEGCLDVRIPAIILQPLIENAIKHGLEPISRQGTVSLLINRSPEGINVEISDDGVGISRDRIGEIMNITGETSSIGIRNVMRRLEINYGKGCFTIEPAVPRGTLCRIFIPCRPST